MTTILILLINFIGWLLLWLIGMFVMPLIIAIVYGYLTDFKDQETATFVFWLSFILYWIGSAIGLITIT